MKQNVLVVFGGQSAEHEVSIMSARNVVAALDRSKYDITLVGIDPAGRWHPYTEKLLAEQPRVPIPASAANDQQIVPYSSEGRLAVLGAQGGAIDVVFPVLHGTMGEDGTMQGLLTLAGVPFVGPGVLGSAICMDKDVTKRLLREAGLPVTDDRVFHISRRTEIDFEAIERELGLPCFVKPANAGSSVGVSKVHNAAEFSQAIEEAFQYDTKILVERQVQGIEVECAVLGNDDPIASVPGDVVSNAEFYSYEAKYIDEHGATLAIPSQQPQVVQDRIRELAVQAFEVLCCEGMARVDFFVTDNGSIYINELNTIPGFTAISMYPKLWEQSGVPYAALVDRLIQLAIKRFERRKLLKTAR